MCALYKTKDGTKTGFVPGVGDIVNGKIEGPENLESANLVRVDEQTPPPQQTAPAAPAASIPAPVQAATPPAPNNPSTTPPQNEQPANKENE